MDLEVALLGSMLIRCSGMAIGLRDGFEAFVTLKLFCYFCNEMLFVKSAAGGFLSCNCHCESPWMVVSSLLNGK